MMEISEFKSVMSHWASGIAVVTTFSPIGHLGFTANSLASVSIDPLLISMSVAKSLFTGQVMLQQGVFNINILTAEQDQLGKIFAGMMPQQTDRFEGLDITYSTNGCSILPNVMAYLECQIYTTVDVGASTLVLGQVIGGRLLQEAQPLLYFHRAWGRFMPLD